MFQKRMQRAVVVLLMAALLLTAPLQAAGWTNRETPGLLETAWGWVLEWVLSGTSAERSFRPATAADEVRVPPKAPIETKSDDGGAIDPDGKP